MSFRSRTRSKPVVPVRRSTSLTRPSSSSSANSRGYTPSSAYAGYQSGSNYLNPYHSGLDPSSYSPRNSGYFDYTSSGSSGSKRRDSYGGSNSSLNALMYSNPLAVHQNPYAYKSPYKDRDRYGNNSSASYTSPYSNRYVSPYSTYENGVTTAGLSFHATPGHSSSSSVATNHAPLSSSNTSLNQYLTPTAHLARSASLRDQERKSRNRNRKQASSKQESSSTSQTPTTPRSLSVSSVHSDIGYEVGCFFFVVDVL